MNILIIEDDKKIREELSKLLNSYGYHTILVNEFLNILDYINSSISLVLLDINLPYENGFTLCKKIKNKMNVPIIFVTSRNTDEDELLSIKVGGIDFITKPYNKSILLEKIRRAINNTDPFSFKEIVKNDYILDLHLSLLKYQGKEIELTRNEFRILYYFFREENRVISKEELLEYLWNDKYYLDENILTVNIGRLRKKAKEIGIEELIKTERKKGYTL